jgi:glyoxylase-like metal-dependent hydrolase (beta-lactamase superfamily II)
MLGPDPLSIDVRCFVVVGINGVVLVDAGPPGTAEVIGQTLERIGATWSDVSDIVLTHRHFDHVGGLGEAAALVPRASIWAGADDAAEIPLEGGRVVLPLAEGGLVRDLRVFHTPGHTPGHVSLLHEALSTLILGDLVGSADGAVVFGPAAFTADPALSRRSLKRMVDLAPRRMLFSHGAEVSDPASQVLGLLAST